MNDLISIYRRGLLLRARRADNNGVLFHPHRKATSFRLGPFFRPFPALRLYPLRNSPVRMFCTLLIILHASRGTFREDLHGEKCSATFSRPLFPPFICPSRALFYYNFFPRCRSVKCFKPSSFARHKRVFPHYHSSFFISVVINLVITRA